MPILENKKVLLVAACALIQLLIVNLAVYMLVSSESLATHVLSSLACLITVLIAFLFFKLRTHSLLKLAAISLFWALFMQYLGILSTVLYVAPFDWLNTLKTMFYAIGWVLASNVYLLPLTLLTSSVFLLFFSLYKQTKKQPNTPMMSTHNAAT